MRPPQPLLTRFSNLKTAAWYWLLPLRGLAHQDVAELRERPQQLRGAESSALVTLKPCPAGRPKNGFGTWSISAGAERQVLDRHLVDVDDAVVRAAEAEVAAGGADVLEADRDVAAAARASMSTEYCWTCGRLLVLVDELDLACRRPSSAPRVLPTRLAARRSGTGWSASPSARTGPAAMVVTWREADVAVVGGADGLVVPRRPVDAVAGADHGLRVERVDHADARRELHAPADCPGTSLAPFTPA